MSRDEYNERLRFWVAMKGLVVGGKCRITTKDGAQEDTMWRLADSYWCKEMDKLIGKVCTIFRIDPLEIIIKCDDGRKYGVPYWICERVEDR